MTPQQIRDRKFNVMKNRSHPAQPDYAQERHIEAMREVTEAQTASNVKFQSNALANAVKQTEIFAAIAKVLVPPAASNAGAAAPGDLTDERIAEIADATPQTGRGVEDFARSIASEVLASNAGAAPVIPEDWQSIPKAPTALMVDRGCDCMPGGIPREAIRAIWWAMLAAAPTPQAT